MRTVQLFALTLRFISLFLLNMKYWVFLVLYSVAFPTATHVPVDLFYGRLHNQGLNAYQGQRNGLYPRGMFFNEPNEHMAANSSLAGSSSIELQPKGHSHHTASKHSPPSSPRVRPSTSRRPDAEKEETGEIRPATPSVKSTAPLPKSDTSEPHYHAEEIKININKLNGGDKNSGSGSHPGSPSRTAKSPSGKLDQPQVPGGKSAQNRSMCQRLKNKCMEIRGVMKDNQLTTVATGAAVGSTVFTGTLGALQFTGAAEGMGVFSFCLWCGVTYQWVSISEDRPRRS